MFWLLLRVFTKHTHYSNMQTSPYLPDDDSSSHIDGTWEKFHWLLSMYVSIFTGSCFYWKWNVWRWKELELSSLNTKFLRKIWTTQVPTIIFSMIYSPYLLTIELWFQLLISKLTSVLKVELTQGKNSILKTDTGMLSCLIFCYYKTL